MRPELRSLIETWHKKDQKALLSGWMGKVADEACDAVPPNEPILSIAKTFLPDAEQLGVSVLTPRSLTFVSQGGRYGISLNDIQGVHGKRVGTFSSGPVE